MGPNLKGKELDAAEDADHVTALGAVTKATRGTILQAINTLQNIRQIIRDNRRERVKRKYTPEVLRRMVFDEITWQIKRTQEMRDAELQVNDEMRAKGTPFVERMKLVNQGKMRWCDEEEVRLVKLLASFKVRPLDEWFGEIDYDTAKEMGMGWIIRFKLDEIVYGEKNTSISSDRR